jgi:hypothetical protein
VTLYFIYLLKQFFKAIFYRVSNDFGDFSTCGFVDLRNCAIVSRCVGARVWERGRRAVFAPVGRRGEGRTLFVRESRISYMGKLGESSFCYPPPPPPTTTKENESWPIFAKAAHIMALARFEARIDLTKLRWGANSSWYRPARKHGCYESPEHKLVLVQPENYIILVKIESKLILTTRQEKAKTRSQDDSGSKYK